MPKIEPPVVVLAFANDYEDQSTYLRKLRIESNNLFEIFDQAEAQGLCKLVHLPNATLELIINTFQDERYRDRIALFHYGGHANSYELLLESQNEKSGTVYGKGLVHFLVRQKGLKFVFLNGCYSITHGKELID